MRNIIVQVLNFPAVEFNDNEKDYTAQQIAEDVVDDFLKLGYLSVDNVSSQYSVFVDIDFKVETVDVLIERAG